jgi:hypothetical protein
MDLVKQLVRRVPGFQPWLERTRAEKEYLTWQQAGESGAAPHLVKQRTILEYAERHGCRTLVETGTFRGTMVNAMLNKFDRIISVELSPELYAAACRRFRGQPRVTLLHGDSGSVLPSVVSSLDRPTLFWLDSHYSSGDTARGVKDTPIYEELTTILALRDAGHVVLVDDARLFIGRHDYPTIDELTRVVKEARPDLSVTVRHDIIRIAPPR